VTAAGAAANSNFVHGQGPGQGQSREHQVVPSDLTLRVNSLESLLVEKGLVDPAALDALIDTMEHNTRVPRYVRGKTGVIVRDHGVYLFPDSNADFRGEKRQHVYSVRFAATDLWGEMASPRDSVHLDLWDDYLERA
jgi:hypothetical protein